MQQPKSRLHPDVIDYMEAVEKLKLPAVAEATPKQLRDAQAKRRLMIRVPVENVGKVYERVFRRENRSIPVRIYEPERNSDETAPLPLIMVFHGGGWVIGNPDSEDTLARGLCKRVSAIVVSVDYGLAPEYQFPTAAEDCYAALEWATENAHKLGIDTNRIAVAGTSAGGNLATVVSQMARDRHGPAIAHQALFCPVTDHGNSRPSYKEFATDYGLTTDAMDWFWRQYIGEDISRADDPYASPIRANDLSRLPDATIIVAECDVLRDEAEDYADALAHAGVDVRTTRYEGMIHGFNLVLGLINAAEDCLEEAAERIRRSFDAR